jgi:hypothetical protein
MALRNMRRTGNLTLAEIEKPKRQIVAGVRRVGGGLSRIFGGGRRERQNSLYDHGTLRPTHWRHP